MSLQQNPQTLPAARQLHATFSQTTCVPSKPRIAAAASNRRHVFSTWNHQLPLCAAAVGAAAGTRWRSDGSKLCRHTGQRGRSSLLAVADNDDSYWKRRGYAAPPSGPAGKPEGYDCYLGKEGQQKLDPKERLFWRIVPALDAAGKKEDAPVTEKDVARGPRFDLLPSPLDGQYISGYGPAQPVLASRLDAMVDLRTASASMPELDPKICENHVPEPYFRTQRPDQRVRAVDVLSGHEPLWKSLEWEGVWFDAVSENDGALRSGFGGAYMDTGIDDLRYSCYASGLPVSGDRDEVVARLNKKPYSRMTEGELRHQCAQLGIDPAETGDETKKELVHLLEESADPFDALSHEDLLFECAYRKLDTSGNMVQLLTRVKMSVGSA